MELPEEMFRVQADAKRKELNELMAKFRKDNEERSSEPTSTARGSGSGSNVAGGRKYERPSERRKRLDHQRGDRNHHGHEGEGDGSGRFGSGHFRSSNKDRDGGRRF